MNGKATTHELGEDLWEMALDGGQSLPETRRRELEAILERSPESRRALAEARLVLRVTGEEPALQVSESFDAALFGKLDALDAEAVRRRADQPTFWDRFKSFFEESWVIPAMASAAVAAVVIALTATPEQTSGGNADGLALLAQAEELALAEELELYRDLDVLELLDVAEDLDVIEALANEGADGVGTEDVDRPPSPTRKGEPG